MTLQLRFIFLVVSIFSLFLFGCNAKGDDKQKEVKPSLSSLPDTKKLSTIEIAKQYQKSTVSITLLDKDKQLLALGSGILIKDGIVITNKHVIEDAKFGFVTLTDSKEKYEIAGYTAIDSVNDIAVLDVPTLKQSVEILFDTTEPKVGEKIYAIGNPEGLTGTFTDGVVSAMRNFGERKIIQISAPISPGSSGGPIVNDDGKIIGLAVGSVIEGQNLNFAVPAINLLALLGKCSLPINLNLISENNAASKNSTKHENEGEGVLIRNIEWYPAGLSSFSIYNGTNYKIHDIRVMFIVYDDKGYPLDYATTTAFTLDEILVAPDFGIEPGLARTFKNFMSDGRHGEPMDIVRRGKIFKARILDYSFSGL